MRRHVRVRGQWDSRGMEPKVEPGPLRPAGDDCERLDARLLQLFAGDAQLGDMPTAKRSIHPPEDGQQDRALAAVVAERDDAVPVESGQAEVRGWLARLDR